GDFDTAEDRIVLDDGLRVLRTQVSDVDRDGVKDLSVTFSGGTSVTLLGVSDASKVGYAGPDADSDHLPGLDGLLDGVGDFLVGLAGPSRTEMLHPWF
ncbi:hypothetical protein, partial [Sphingomonas phyllosphaerae]|uniref:hypothetical protein n=1 Tax=Sphingomonas phyllosphaerae TaxID=257003 RepID=UPI00241364AD